MRNKINALRWVSPELELELGNQIVVREPSNDRRRRDAASGVLFLLVLALLPNGSALGRETGTFETADVVIHYDEPLGGVAKETAGTTLEIRRNLESRLGWELGYRPTIVIVGDRARFSAMGAGGHAVAFAVPARGLIALDNSRVRIDPFSLEPTLTHELAHLILHRHIPEDRLPRWLDEGVAQWVSGGAAERVLMGEAGPRLKQAVLSGRWVPFQALEDSLPREEPAISLAYEQSRSLVEFIVRKYDEAGLIRILDRLQKGESVEGAVAEALSISFAALEADWREDLQGRVTWIAYFSESLPVILFAFGAVVTVLGFIRFLIRKRRYKDDDEPWDRDDD